jgi:hypothetical protein
MLQQNQSSTEAKHTKSLYRLGGAAAIAVILVGLADIGMTFLPGNASPKPGDVLGWFALFRINWLFGLRGLGLFNIFNTALGLVLFYVLYKVHARANTTYATLALILMTMASAIYISNNRALPMLSLASQYQSAATPAQKDLVASAGLGLLAQAEDFTPGTFVGFTLVEVAGVIMSLVMLGGRIIGKWTSLTCLLGYSLLLVFSSAVCFTPENFDPLLGFSMIAGLLSMVGFALVARRLFQLGGAAEAEVR